MSDAALKLRKAVHAALAADGSLVTLLGGPRIHVSASGKRMTEHEFELALWAGQTAATARNLAIAARIEQVLHDAPLVLTAHRLVFLYWQSSTSDRDERSKLPRVSLSFTALTEAL